MKAILKNRLQTLQQITGNNNLILDFDSLYGGYQLLERRENGALYGCFGFSSMERRIPAREMISRLDAIISGIEYGRKHN